MPIKLDLDHAERQLRRAVQWANSDRAVPDEWTETTELVAAGTSKTLVAGLGAAILAKATNPKIDPLSIKPEDSRPRSFAIRSLCEHVLVPLSRGGQHPAFHLGTRGSQPMNNQPYFRYSHLDDVKRHRAGETLDQLRSALRDLDALTQEEALAALAAYVRSRTKAEKTYQSLINEEVPSSVELTQLLDALDGFLDPDAAGVDDRPLRLQAVVGGLIRATGVEVSTQGLYDPSRRSPGDAHVPDSENPRWAAEVKARSIDFGGAVAFLDRVREWGGIDVAWVVAIDPSHEPLDRAELATEGRARGLLVTVTESVVELVGSLLGHPQVDAGTFSDTGEAIGLQLRAMKAEGTTIQEWTKALG